MKPTVKVVKLGEVKKNEMCSVDPDYTHAQLVSLMVAHNFNQLDVRDEYWFGKPECYQFAPKSAPAMVLVFEGESE